MGKNKNYIGLGIRSGETPKDKNLSVGTETCKIWPDQLIIPKDNKIADLKNKEGLSLSSEDIGTTRCIDKKFPPKNKPAARAESTERNLSWDKDTTPQDNQTLKTPERTCMP